MEVRRHDFLRKRYFIIGSLLTLVAGAIGGSKINEKIMTRNITDLPETFAMLTDIHQRRTHLKNKQFVVENVSFDNNFVETINCENTIFLKCQFQPDSWLRIKELNNVEFVNCFIEDAEISGGSWNNVKFSGSSARGEFVILAGEGNNVSFVNCDFSGEEPSDQTTHQNHFGKVGGLSSVSFDKCVLRYLEISSRDALVINDSELRKIDAAALGHGGTIKIKKINVKKYIDFGDGVFSHCYIEDSEFDLIGLDRVKCNQVRLERCTGQFVGEFMNLKEMLVLECNFFSGGEKRNPFENQYAAFCTNGSTIDKLVLDNLKFSGANGTMYIGGSKNILFNKLNPESGKPFFRSKFNEISIKSTPLRNSFFGHIETGKLSIKNSEIENSHFGNSHIGLLELSDVKLLGSIDFRGAQVEGVIKEKTVHKRGLTILQDPGKNVNI
jgi:uncharacterized protein YjbI with pentapeptide repeats